MDPVFHNPVLDREDLPSLDEIKFEKLSEAFRTLSLLRAGFTFFFFLLTFVLVVIIGGLWQFYILISGLIGLLLLLIFLMLRAWKLYDFKGYALREHDIVYTTGWFWKRKVVVPFNRIQHVEIRRGPLEELLRLRRLQIYTAGGSASDLNIPGLEPDLAEQIRFYISVKTGLDEEE